MISFLTIHPEPVLIVENDRLFDEKATIIQIGVINDLEFVIDPLAMAIPDADCWFIVRLKQINAKAYGAISDTEYFYVITNGTILYMINNCHNLRIELSRTTEKHVRQNIRSYIKRGLKNAKNVRSKHQDNDPFIV